MGKAVEIVIGSKRSMGWDKNGHPAEGSARRVGAGHPDERIARKAVKRVNSHANGGAAMKVAVYTQNCRRAGERFWPGEHETLEDHRDNPYVLIIESDASGIRFRAKQYEQRAEKASGATGSYYRRIARTLRKAVSAEV